MHLLQPANKLCGGGVTFGQPSSQVNQRDYDAIEIPPVLAIYSLHYDTAEADSLARY